MQFQYMLAASHRWSYWIWSEKMSSSQTKKWWKLYYFERTLWAHMWSGKISFSICFKQKCFKSPYKSHNICVSVCVWEREFFYYWTAILFLGKLKSSQLSTSILYTSTFSGIDHFYVIPTSYLCSMYPSNQLCL